MRVFVTKISLWLRMPTLVTETQTQVMKNVKVIPELLGVGRTDRRDVCTPLLIISAFKTEI